jgi:hypothetical protein
MSINYGFGDLRETCEMFQSSAGLVWLKLKEKQGMEKSILPSP